MMQSYVRSGLMLALVLGGMFIVGVVARVLRAFGKGARSCRKSL
jgi:hypothetical protein